MTDAVPPIEPSQFETDQVGKLARSVNMFRGDVNYAKNLVQLPGKPGDATLAIGVGLQYTSNVSQDVAQWNLSAPTGVAGLGWSLEYDRIEASTSGALSAAARRYAYRSGGTSSALIAETSPWLRLRLAKADAAALAAGPVSDSVVKAFATQQIALDGSASVAAIDGAWTIADPVYERTFTVRTDDAGAAVYDGGERFALQDYSFWQIAYYALYEKWEVTTETGEVRIFGGGVSQTAGGFRQSSRNGVAWAVKWGGDAGNWSGPSQQAGGGGKQAQYAVAWNLVERRDRWGDHVDYAYNEFGRDADGLLKRNAEQQVGVGGLPYTKATYPTSITDLFGRTVRFGYGDKSHTAQAQEYMDAHKLLEPAATSETPPKNLGAPNAYQDCYETLYLQSVTVAGPRGETLYTLKLAYAPEPLMPLPGAVAAPSAKRLLTSINESNAAGDELPGYEYSYCAAPADGPNLGALKSISYPQGSAASWSYAERHLDAAQRAIDVHAPAASATPLVWYGEDYVVSMWTSQDGATVTVDVYTWNGAWQRWPGGTVYHNADATVQAASAQAVANDVSFAISFATSDGDTQVLLFSRESALPFEWKAAAPVTIPGQATSLAGGDTFVVATATTQSAGDTKHELFRWTWDWRTGWVGGGPGGALNKPVLAQTDPLFVLAQGEYYLTADAGSAATTLSIFWVDATAQWHAGGTQQFPWSVWPQRRTMVWAAGPSLAAIVVAAGAAHTSYGVQLVRWDADYAFIHQQWTAGLAGEPIDAFWPPPPSVIDNQFVGVRNNLFRFDGVAWAHESFPISRTRNGWLGIAYGSDVAIQAANDGSDATTTLIAYDPNEAGGAAFGSPLAVTTPLPGSGDVHDEGWPSASGESFVVGRNAVFYRGPDTSWRTGVQSPVHELPSGGVDSKSVINEAPAFLAYLVPDANEPANRAVQALPLRNGAVLTHPPRELSRTAYYTPAEARGTDPDGQLPSAGATLTTYPATAETFSETQLFTLYRYAGQAMSGPITAYPVTSLEITDGFGATYRTSYEFDAASALCDASGTVVKFYRSASYQGARGVDDAGFGRTVYSYYNGTVAGAAYSMLDGSLLQQVKFTGAAVFQTAWSDALALDALRVNEPASAVSAPLRAAFSTHGVSLGDAATVQALQVDGAYAYWEVTDPARSAVYNLDYTGDPSDPAGLRAFTGTAVHSETTQWTVLTARNSSPTTPDASPARLHGGCARPAGRTERRDGVALTTTFDYLPTGFGAAFSGMPVRQGFAFINLSGASEAHTQVKAYAYDAYPQVLGVNLLTPVVQSRHTVAAGGRTVTTASSATELSGWTQGRGAKLTVYAPSQHWVWSGDPSGADVGEFAFGGTPNAFWLRASTANARNDAGLVIDSTDAGGVRHGTLYDAGVQAEVALVSNASFAARQAMYAGFESYEDASGWQLEGGAAVDTTDAHAGVACLKIPAGATATATALTPDVTQRQYFSAWVKTDAGYAAGSRSGWTLTVRSGQTTLGTPVEVDFVDTGGRWTFVGAPLDLPALASSAQGALTVTVTAANAGSGPVRTDDVTFVPLATQFTARTYDALFMLPLDRLDQSGKHWRTFRDTFMRPLGGTDAIGNPTSLELTYLSRAGNDGFSAEDPNASIALKSFGVGDHQAFRDAQGWKAAWAASPAGALAASAGVLAHRSTSSGATLTPVNAPDDGELALYVQLAALDGGALALTDVFSVSLGGAVFAYDPRVTAWTLTLDRKPVQPCGKVTGPPRACLLVQIGGRVLFYVDGRLLFSQQATLGGAPVISTGANVLGLTNLTLFKQPAIKVHYSDATGALRQAHVLTAEDYLLQQTVRDGRGKRIVQTKPAPGAFGSGAALPVPAYRPGFVDLAAFEEVLQGSGAMTGDVADWYDGTHDTDDEHYPYSRSLLEPSPLGRVLESGLPGKAMAIVDPGSSSPASRATLQVQYAANGPDELDFGSGKLPAGHFHIGRQVGPTKTVQTTVLDATRTVTARFVSGEEPCVNTTQPQYSAGVTATTVELPDAFSLGDGQQMLRRSNAAGQLVTRDTPDGQRMIFMYGAGGRLRFLQDAQGAVDGTVVYCTWDVLGRRRSRGTFQFSWTPATHAELQALALQPLWPEGQSKVPFTPLRTCTYDGDGSDPASLGQLVGVTSSAAGAATAETYRWNATGMLAARGLTIADGGRSLGTFETTFGYDAQQRVTSIGYPAFESTGLKSAIYAYDGRDNLLSITDDAGLVIAAWTYNAIGKPVTVALGANAISGTQSWDSAARLLAVAAHSSSTSFSYSLGYATDGTMKTLEESTTGGGVSDAASLTYGYDPLQRLRSASGAQQPHRDVSVGYENAAGKTDHNGNVQSLAIGGAGASAVAYEHATNRIASVTPPSGAAATYTWLANGLLDARTATAGAPAVVATYIAGTTLPAALRDPDADTSLRFGYDGNGHRVLKQLDGKAAELSVNAGAPGPLVTVDASGAATAWIYGPTGLVGFARSRERYHVVSDYLRTPRVVVDATGALRAAYAYNVFGSAVSVTEPSPGWLPWRFGGRQWDAELGLSYFGARMYDPSTGRFLGPDPRGQYASGYVYVGNQPTMLIDPSGEMSTLADAGMELALAILFLGATIATAGIAAVAMPAAVAAGGAVAGVVTGAGIGAVGGAVSGLALQGLRYDLATPPGKWNASTFATSVWIGAEGGALGGFVSGAVGAFAAPFAAAEDASAADLLTPTETDPPGGAADISSSSSDGLFADSDSDEAGPAARQAQRAAAQPETNPAPPTAEDEAAKRWEDFKAIAPRRIGVGAFGGAAGNAVQGATQQYLTNFVEHRPSASGVGQSAGWGAFSGLWTGGGGGAFGAANATYELVASAWSAVQEDPFMAIARIGGVTGGAFAGLALYNLDAYGSN